MSKVHPLINGWVSYDNGRGTMLVEVNMEFDENDPIVKDRPDLFTQPEKPAPVRGPGRPKSSDA